MAQGATRRIDRALELLRDNRLPLADVALRSDFADQRHFGRVFKSNTGKTPRAFRRAMYGANALIS
ncbi:MAG: helix-turn-helix domain-containing protein [Pseudorhizobium sp.]